MSKIQSVLKTMPVGGLGGAAVSSLVAVFGSASSVTVACTFAGVGLGMAAGSYLGLKWTKGMASDINLMPVLFVTTIGMITGGIVGNKIAKAANEKPDTPPKTSHVRQVEAYNPRPM